MAISKSKRYEIFERDGFQCRYCGKQPPEVCLEVDHVIPSSKGGTDDPENLTTACFDCNSGKSNKMPGDHIPQSSPRVAQEYLETVKIAELAVQAKQARLEIKEILCDYWCHAFGCETIETSTLSSLMTLAAEFSIDDVYHWIELSIVNKVHHHYAIRYIYGIARNVRVDRGKGVENVR